MTETSQEFNYSGKPGSDGQGTRHPNHIAAGLATLAGEPAGMGEGEGREVPPPQHPGHVGWTGSQGGLLPLSCKGEAEEAAMAASKSDRKGMEVGFPLSPC